MIKMCTMYCKTYCQRTFRIPSTLLEYVGSDEMTDLLRTRYLDIRGQCKIRWNDLLSDEYKQVKLWPNHDATGLRELTEIVELAIVESYSNDGSCKNVTKLRSLLEFMLPLLKEYLPP